MPKIIWCVTIMAYLLGALPAAANVNQTQEPQYIWLKNGGAYALSSVSVKWKVGSTTKQKTFTANVASLDSFCVDLSQVKASDGHPIPLGAEVWLVAHIAGGDTESCRKDTKRYYQISGEGLGHLMGGTTLQNNRCKNNPNPPAQGAISSGNSTACAGSE
ncbi:MAG: hypothetical protein ACX94B_04060 [Henriciella sp.]